MLVGTRTGVSVLVILGSFATSVTAAADPTKQECIAANESAQGLRRAGNLREARARLAVCVAASCPAVVREDCAQRLDEVEKAAASIVFVAKDASGNDLSAVKVSVDGSPFADRLDGTALSVDLGEHTFRFELDGLPTIEKKLVIREGEKDRRERVTFVAPAVAKPTTPATTDTGHVAKPHDAPVVAPTPKEGTPADGSAGGTQRTIGLVVGGAGVVGIGIGVVFGFVSKSTYDHAVASECGNNPNGCSLQGQQDGQTAHTQAAISTAGFIAGGALAVGGAVLFFTAPRGMTITPTVGKEGAGLSLRGVW